MIKNIIQALKTLFSTIFGIGLNKTIDSAKAPEKEPFVYDKNNCLGNGKVDPAIILADTMDSIAMQLTKIQLDPDDVQDIKVMLLVQLEANDSSCIWILSESIAGMTEDDVILHLMAKTMNSKKFNVDQLQAKIDEIKASSGLGGVKAERFNVATGEYIPEAPRSSGPRAITKSMDELVNKPSTPEPTGESLEEQLAKLWGMETPAAASEESTESNNSDSIEDAETIKD